MQPEQETVHIEAHPGGTWCLTAACTVSRPIEEVFAFFSDARNLEELTPSLLRFRTLTETPLVMREGLLIDYALRVRGVPLRWRSEITAWDPPFRFVDEQRKGPYRQWIHQHIFRETGDGTEVRDRVLYRAPGGSLVHRWFVAPDLRKIFAYRTRILQDRFSPDPPSSPAS